MAAIAATHQILRTAGPVKLTMRAVAAEANVNPGLLHRHFGSRAGLLRAAADDLRAVSEARVAGATGLREAATDLLAPNEPWFSHGLAWSILQDELDSVLPDTFPAVERFVHLAAADGHVDRTERLGLVAALLSLALGWRLYEPYIARSLDLGPDDLPAVEARLRELLVDLTRAPERDTTAQA